MITFAPLPLRPSLPRKLPLGDAQCGSRDPDPLWLRQEWSRKADLAFRTLVILRQAGTDDSITI